MEEILKGEEQCVVQARSGSEEEGRQEYQSSYSLF